MFSVLTVPRLPLKKLQIFATVFVLKEGLFVVVLFSLSLQNYNL